jgi:hypothetical protein
MRKLLSIFTLALLYITVVSAQAEFSFPVTVSDNAGLTSDIYFGLDLTATDGLDGALGEAGLPGPPPENAYYGAWILPDGVTQSYRDYRAPDPVSWPYTGQKHYQIKIQSTDFPMTISWNGLPPEIAATSLIEDPFGVLTPVSFSGTGEIVVTLAAIPYLDVYVDYVGIGPSGPAPIFGITTPEPLDFGNVAVLTPSMLPVNVSNTGDADLVISNVTSSNSQFVVSPLNATIPAGGNLDFDVTFTPTSIGLKTGTLTFFHNGPGPSTDFAVQGTGVDAGPTFSVTPTFLAFGNVNVGSTSDKIVTVTNLGTLNDLIINTATIATPEFTVLPAGPVTIGPGLSQVFTVTFAPLAPGPYTGTLVFDDNAGGPHTVDPLTGNGYVPPAEYGLIFDEDTVYQLEDASYMEVIQLKALTANAKAIQFRLETNKALDDNTILIFQSITKGTDVADPSWILETNVVRGPITPNGASKDEVFVLLYNINQGPGWALGPGDWNNLFHVNYKIAKLTALQNNIKSSIQVANEEASTFDGNPIDITGSRDYLTVIAQSNNGGGWGDVNGDGCVDILDLIMVVDHIVGRDSLTPGSAEFMRADIAPWPGTPEPQPDGFVNVQDLAVIQNIILTGFFPNGNPVGFCGYAGMPKSNGDADAIVNLYINSEGISAYLDSKVGIRGAQIEFGNLVNDPQNMIINTDLGQGYYLKVNELLRTLMYDRFAQKYIEAGDHFMADMPFVISNPEAITLDKIILVDINTHKVMNIEVNLIYGTPTLPYDYILYQNYPNPFNPNTSVKFQVPKTSDVIINIYDMLGQKVRTLFANQVMRGTYTVNWDGLNDAGVKMSTGTYIYRMVAGEFVQSKKMVLLK